MIVGDHLTVSAPFLHGLLPLDSGPLTLRAIEVAPNCFSDVHIFSEGGRDWVLLLDSTEENILRRQTESALRLTEERLRQSLRMETLGRLAGGVAHDFNNLLTVIIGYSQFLLDGLRPDDPLFSSAEQIHDAAKRAGLLTAQLLAFSRKQIVQARILDLNRVVTEMSQMLRRLIGENIRLETRLDPDLGLIKMDSGHIEQVIVNLVVNSRDAMPTGGLLRIETGNIQTEAGPAVALSIIDTGYGMDRETLAQIFEPFFSTKEPGKGTGLGLATVYGIVRQNGGEITVESEPGRGTAMRVFLPVSGEARDAEDSTPRRGPEKWRSADTMVYRRILLVEDDVNVRELVADALRRSGCEVLQANASEEALRIEEQETGPIHLLITDILLPGVPGNELAGRLRTRRPQMQVLFVSGFVPEPMALEPGIAFLQKPFTVDALIGKVRQVIDVRSAGAQSSSVYPLVP
jgi:signal transduction histidine kinase/ActR/RegA family two-component response regulator